MSEHKINLSLSTLIAGAFGLTAAAVAATWYLRADRIEELKERLAAYEALDKASLPNLLKDLRVVAADAGANLKLEKMAPELTRLRKENDELSATVTALKNTVTLEEKFALAPGESRGLLGNRYQLGVASIYSDFASLMLDGSSRTMRIAEYSDVPTPFGNFRIVIRSISRGQDNNSGSVSFEVLKRQ